MILSLFDFTGNMVRPWLEDGYDCTIVDVQHPAGRHLADPFDIGREGGAGHGNLWRVGADVLDWDWRGDVEFVFAFPPCTDLAVSGARWFQAKGMGALIDALTMVECARYWCEDVYRVPFMIENPVGMLSTYWRQPDFSFDPCDFGGYEGGQDDDYTKRTHLWTGHGFKMPPRRPIPATRGSAILDFAPGPDRKNLRSATPMGFARAVFEANQPGAELAPFVPEPDSLFGAVGGL